MTNPTTQALLAIVIPYYRFTFFETLLAALAAQTDKRFHVYIGDDASPENPSTLVSKYSDRIRISYHRFDERIGHIALTAHWDRCVGRIGDEKWVWVVPDDDVPAPNCVETFYRAVDAMPNEPIYVFRFRLEYIDRAGVRTGGVVASPLLEDNLQFYSRVLSGNAGSTLGDNIFRRDHLQESGFVNFPKAWGSDHATVLRVAAGGKIAALNDAIFQFRMSGDNISSNTQDGLVKLRARIQFAQWLKANEAIFPRRPDTLFYQQFYWKGEFFVVHVWQKSAALWWNLYRLRYLCLGIANPLPVLIRMLFVAISPKSI